MERNILSFDPFYEVADVPELSLVKTDIEGSDLVLILEMILALCRSLSRGEPDRDG